MSQRRPYRTEPFQSEAGKPPLSWIKSYAREYLRIFPQRTLRQAVTAGYQDAKNVLLDYIKESRR